MKNPFANRFATELLLLSPGVQSVLFETDFNPQLAELPQLKMLRERLRPQVQLVGDVGVLPIYGVLARRPDPMELIYGAECSEGVLATVKGAATDPNVKALVLDFDSPGGFLTGGPEIGDAVRNLGKPCVAWTGGSMSSLAYWIGAQANEIVASRSASVGSIGVYSAFMDVSKAFERDGVKIEVFTNKEGTFKAAGLEGTSLTPEQRAGIQARMDETFAAFRGDVEKKRGKLKDEALRGQSFNARQGQQLGLVDRIGDLNFAIARAKALVRGK